MIRFCPLFSGSSGNSTYLSCGSTAVLVDAGGNCKRITQALERMGQSLARLNAIFITHEHSDHVSALKVLLKRCSVPVYGSVQTLEYLIYHDLLPAGTVVEEMEGLVTLPDFSVTAFDTPHDSEHSLGYRFDCADGRSVGVATDMGCYTETVHSHLCGCDLVLLESNYDPRMLESSSYPYYLKRRIRSERGHLSNDCCAAAASRLVQSGTTRLVLAHLSKENNYELLARQTTRTALEAGGMAENRDYLLEVAHRYEALEPIRL